MVEDKRSAPRHRVLKAATISFGGGAISCTVRNLSVTGASLEVASPRNSRLNRPRARRRRVTMQGDLAQREADRRPVCRPKRQARCIVLAVQKGASPVYGLI